MIINESLLYDKLNAIEINTDIYEARGNPGLNYTVKINAENTSYYLHSKFNPMKQAEDFANAKYSKNGHPVVYGLGLGYHVMELAKLCSPEQRLYVIEGNLSIVKLALSNPGLADTLNKQNVFLYVCDNMHDMAACLKEVLSVPDISLIIYEPSLKAMPPEMQGIKDLLINYKTRVQSFELFEPLLNENYARNTSMGYENGGVAYKDAFKGVPAVVISAGASLAHSTDGLKALSRHCKLISVGRAAAYLDSVGIVPDFYVESDCQHLLASRYKKISNEPELFILATADHELNSYQGKKYILFDKYSADESERQYTVDAGGSVSTIAAGLAVLMGCDPIIFIGLDLCYWSASTHAGSKRGYAELKGGSHVTANDGNKYYTSQAFYNYLKWHERFIANNTDTEFINCTALGALIDGAPNCTIDEVIRCI